MAEVVLLLLPEALVMQHRTPSWGEAGVKVEGGVVLLLSARAGGLGCTLDLLSMVVLVLLGRPMVNVFGSRAAGAVAADATEAGAGAVADAAEAASVEAAPDHDWHLSFLSF